MKSITKTLICFMASSFIFLSCDDADEMGGNEKTVSVAPFNSVLVGENTVVRFDRSSTNNQSVVIKGNASQVGSVKLEVNDGVLRITSSSDVQLNDSLTIIANPEVLTNITLEADQRAVIYWDDLDICLDNLDVKTEANSMLELSNICASNINIQQEAQSRIQVQSWVGLSEDSIAIEKADVQIINATTYLIEENRIIVAETISEVENNNTTFVVFKGAELKSYALVPNVNAKLEATSELLADETPISSLDIQLEGESTAKVWVTDVISGKGEGKSALFYRGSPAIQYTTQGEAIIQEQ